MAGNSQFLLKIAVLFVSLFSAAYAAVPNGWACGTMGTEELSYMIANNECPKSIKEIGSCCVAHDNCYSQQLGQINCDNDFCKCMEDALNRTGCKADKGPSVHGWCTFVRFNGGIAYGLAGLKKVG
ncbi:hypothetical protein M3Y96_00568000 [Aphelenchoides besseyi]|nr:hypothetical protein M3Y96_00568000 [Aphelenchoides besseyi]